VDEVPVLVVGGSLVGLSTALFLAWHGVPSLVVERHPGTAIHPRAAHFSQRTIELYRGVGLEPAIMEAAAQEFAQNGAIMSVETLAGRELDWYFRSINEGFETLSPVPRLFVTQIGLEPLLRRRAEELGARLEYATELVSLEPDGDGVTAVVRGRDGGGERRVRAEYVVAADGARSGIRERLGIGTRGHGAFSESVTIYFRADVKPLLRERNLSVIYVFNPRLQGFFRFSLAGDAGFLVVNTTADEAGERNRRVADEADVARCVEWVRTALGADVPVEIENVQRWTAAAEWAERFAGGAGRVFLAGDSAHVMPPTGGFGGNTGVQDAHNLAWKLAFVLRGLAPPELLASYDAERRPVAAFTTEQAYTRYVLRLDPGLGADDLAPLVEDARIELGYRYGAGDEEPYEDPRAPTGRPGTRAPHVEARRGGERVSTIDLFGRRLVALLGAEARVDDLDGVDVHRLGADLVDEDGALARAYGIGPPGASLVRPDGFVAWRAADGAEGLADAVRRTLAHGG
jgi:2-polyprenyl-6-methoxyphenol hydroxylase-like FAD-dependent oxidoreductase